MTNTDGRALADDLADRLLTLSDVEQSFGRTYNAKIMREAEAALRSAPSGEMGRSVTEEMVEAGAKAHNPLAFEKDDEEDGGGYLLEDIARDSARIEVREILTAALAIPPSPSASVPGEGVRSVIARTVEILKALTKFVEVNVPSDGLAKGKVTLALGYEGAQMLWIAQNSYEESAFNELGGLIGLCHHLRERCESKLAADQPGAQDAVGSDYLNAARNWFGLRLSQQREIAALLGLPPQGTSSQFDWAKLVLQTAKERGELPRVAERIAALQSARGSEEE